MQVICALKVMAKCRANLHPPHRVRPSTKVDKDCGSPLRVAEVVHDRPAHGYGETCSKEKSALTYLPASAAALPLPSAVPG